MKSNAGIPLHYEHPSFQERQTVHKHVITEKYLNKMGKHKKIKKIRHMTTFSHPKAMLIQLSSQNSLGPQTNKKKKHHNI
jgi:hypothetical protein